MPASIVLKTPSDPNLPTTGSQPATRMPATIIRMTGSFGATEGSETTVLLLDVSMYRSVAITTIASSWGTATVALKIYPSDSGGNKNTNPFFNKSVTANVTALDFITEMGGAVSVATTYPPASPAAGGSFVGPFGNWILITEQCTSFTSGTNTISLEISCKG